MSTFSNYIDRQKSGPGSSEKSQKVHSANWTEEIQLRKELDCLKRQEQQRVCRLSSDQRLVVDRFYRMLSRSVDVAEKHERMKETLPRNKVSKTKEKEVSVNVEKHMRQIRCLSAFPKPPVPVFRRTARRRSKSCEPAVAVSQDKEEEDEQLNRDVLDLPPRPMTSLEKRNKMWERQLNSVTQRINRARSAPARPAVYKVPEFSKATKPKNFDRKIPRQKTNTVDFSSEVLRFMREKEVDRQNHVIREFLKTLTPLQLVPWTPFEDERNINEASFGSVDSVLRTEVEGLTNNGKKHVHRSALYDLDHRVIGSCEAGPSKAWT